MYSQLCHGGFTALNTRLFQVLLITLSHENGRSKEKRGEIQMAEGTVQSEKDRERNRRATAFRVDKTEGNMTGVDIVLQLQNMQWFVITLSS